MAGEAQAFIDILSSFNVRKFTLEPCEYLIKVLKAFDDLLCNDVEAKIFFDSERSLTEFNHFIDKLFIAHDGILDKLKDPNLIKYILKISEIPMVETSFFDLYTILKHIEGRNYDTKLSMLHPELDPKLDDVKPVASTKDKIIKQKIIETKVDGEKMGQSQNGIQNNQNQNGIQNDDHLEDEQEDINVGAQDQNYDQPILPQFTNVSPLHVMLQVPAKRVNTPPDYTQVMQVNTETEQEDLSDSLGSCKSKPQIYVRV